MRFGIVQRVNTYFEHTRSAVPLDQSASGVFTIIDAAPNSIKSWTAPRYRQLTPWDQLLLDDAWREKWSPNGG
jgi:hypothetical protein